MLQALQCPDTRLHVRFLIHVLKMSHKFELQFQSASVLIHKLFSSWVNLLKTIAIQFIKESVLVSSQSIWQINFEDKNNQVTLDNILIGSSTSTLLPENDSRMLRLMKVSIIMISLVCHIFDTKNLNCYFFSVS